jgi:hypothetical protein
MGASQFTTNPSARAAGPMAGTGVALTPSAAPDEIVDCGGVARMCLG